MPNGESKNWIRFCAAIEGFRGRYGCWPSSIKVPVFFIDELQNVLSENDFMKISSMITLIGDDSGFAFVAEDESGNQYNYEKEGFSNERPDNRAIDWLGVKPDYYD